MLARNTDSLFSLAAWLRTCDPDDTYNYASPSKCVLSCYYPAVGEGPVSIGPSTVTFYNRKISENPRQSLPFGFAYVASSHRNHWEAMGFPDKDYPLQLCRTVGESSSIYTFGLALTRCEHVIAYMEKTHAGLPLFSPVPCVV